MQDNIPHSSLAASRRELDAKHELLQQLGYADRFFDHNPDDDIASLPEKLALLDHDTDRWVQSEYEWAMEEAADSVVSIPDLFNVEEEDEESCLPSVYDPTFFRNRQPSTPSAMRARSQSLTQPPRSDCDKPLPSVPPLRLRARPSLPLVPPSTPEASQFPSPVSSQPTSPRTTLMEKHTPPPSPSVLSGLSSSPKTRPFPRPHAASVSGSPSGRTLAPRHATYPSISSTMSLLEDRETDAGKRAAVYVSGEDPALQSPAPRLAGRGRSSSATVTRTSDEACGPFSIGSSPRRKQRPILPALSTSHSTPQLRTLAELASIPSPSLVPPARSILLPSPMNDATLTPDSEEVSPGEAITWSPSDDGDWASQSALADPALDAAVEGAGTGNSGTALASRWSLDSVASRPRIRQVVVAVPDVSSSPASKAKKRDRLLSLISGRARAGSVGKTNPPPNTPRGSSDVPDIRRSESREVYTAMQGSFSSATRPSFNSPAVPPKIQLTPSVSSSSGSSASTLATPIEPMQPSPLPDTDPFGAGAPSCMYEEAPVFAENPHVPPESPLLAPMDPRTPPSPPHQSLALQVPDRPPTPDSPPPQPTLPLPSPSTPSPSFLVPTPRSQSFFASLKGKPRRRKKKLVISGAPLEFHLSRASSSLQAQTPAQGTEQQLQLQQLRALERSRRVQNVIKWCESFGPVRKIDTKEDGSLHVYWKDWEVADMVCRVQAQVVIKDVGRVNLAWSYIS
ncbi:hypothetical protein BN946_scf184840.g14 [Trametes cinnabarina]|uniref:Uncharacterized protein n=1 Tax=Pycnoporus cinnabarinus TaxID=5643 RepID=A0A060SN60_PYCCI|nr:hypothetical protein BN946_scf184840.g14 [Trametes cinnabarina]